MNEPRRKPRLLYLVGEDWFFCSHRLPLAEAALREGYEVIVATRVTRHGEAIRAAGLRLIPFEISRRGLNPFAELGTILRLAALYRHIQPDLVHHVTLKPVVYGSIAARLAGVQHMVNALAGLGWLFISRSFLAAPLRFLVQHLLRRLLAKGLVIVQNPDDSALLENLGIPLHRLRLIRGSGVDLACYRPGPAPAGTPLVVLASRMLRDKGVREFVEAARLLKQQGVAARFVLVGVPDSGNPASLPIPMLESWVKEEAIEWWGQRNDMPMVYAEAHVACLPSYREGLPKSLLEAAACGLPIVSTDVPGCREAVIHGETGLLVPPRDAPALAQALRRLLEDADLRRTMGDAGRRLAERDFSLENSVAQTLALYRDLLKSPKA